MNAAPIVVFTYKRLEPLKKTIKALQANPLAKVSELFIFSDGPKNQSDFSRTQQVRSYLRQIDGFAKIIIKEADQNKGLAASIIGGVTEVLKTNDRVIVLEDDLVTAPGFLGFMNEALSYYRTNDKIFSISGYSYPFELPKEYEYDAYAVTRGCSWGWATWKDRWEGVDWEVRSYQTFRANKKQYKIFNLSGSDLSGMLEKQMKGKIDSWAIRWYFHQFQQQSLTIYPVRSFISNEGFDAEATHTNNYNRYKTTLNLQVTGKFKLPSVDSYNLYFQRRIKRKFSITTRIIWGRGMSLLKKMKLIYDN